MSSGVAELQAIAHRVMLERDLLPDFSAAAQRELEGLRAPAAAPALRDLRALAWSSIDNDDSRDLDQIEVAERSGDAVRVRVGIADVDALVAAGSAIDAHARHNTTSVYTAAQIFPMLPERLSTDLTSLNPHQDRVALVIEFDVQPDGSIGRSDIYRALVRNQAQLAYAAVAVGLEGHGPLPAPAGAPASLAEQLRLQDAVAQCLRKVRQAHGALSLESLEARPVFADGALADLRTEARNRAQDLIEDFMIAANGVTAQFLAKRGLPVLRRVLRTPKRWGRIVALAADHGERLPASPDARALNAFLVQRRVADPVRFADLSLAVIKLLGRGEYDASLPGEQSPGHFALAVPDYAHSTAPNRRFPDLITQRLLKAALDGRGQPYDAATLQGLAAHCTTQEDNAAHVERQVRKSAAALLLAPRIGARFDALVTGVNDSGTWVRISHPTVEGKLLRGFEHLDVGDAVRVQLLHTDVQRGFIDFARSSGDRA
ncbi:MAG TPA: RNB domain-containing ribonuclease [Steroidobacteraceae bacterium]|nr:RNB domain-containing ribonuclease [Steroidobacteraceae bacterium]